MSDTAQPIQPLTIDVVSDVVCPWCFIGKRRLEKALALKPHIPVEVRFHPYFLNDWVPREGMARDEYLTAKFGSPERYKDIAKRVSAAAAAEGLTYAVDKMKRQPNTTDCHRLILWASEVGKAAQMKQRIMDLYFTEGADLSSRCW
jgi:predicted DsbA family dithiol-disulfide isomerase